MKPKDLTTADVAERLQRPERTVRLWCKQGRFDGARSVESPRGDYWLIPESALRTFQAPKLGAPRKTPSATQKRATGQKRASRGHSTGAKKGGKR